MPAPDVHGVGEHRVVEVAEFVLRHAVRLRPPAVVGGANTKHVLSRSCVPEELPAHPGGGHSRRKQRRALPGAFIDLILDLFDLTLPRVGAAAYHLRARRQLSGP